MNILQKIVSDKRKEIAAKKKVFPIDIYREAPLFGKKGNSLKTAIRNGPGVIAEFKRRSPSERHINDQAEVETVVQAYTKAGVSGISVLTDTRYFGGSTVDIIRARNTTAVPILRKDFIIDSYQLFESKALGADAILLIASVLTPETIRILTQKAHETGLEVLLEVHDEIELERSLDSKADIIGINNRDLRKFTADTNKSKELAQLIPDRYVKISESGIDSPETAAQLKSFGFEGFLIGTHFMKATDPGSVAKHFIQQLNLMSDNFRYESVNDNK